MAIIRIVGKKGSHAVREIAKDASIPRYNGKKHGSKVDFLINYGLAGNRLEKFYRLNPSARKLTMLNRGIGKSKYAVVLDAKKVGLRVPQTALTLPEKAIANQWIEKKQHSIGGKGIKKANKNRRKIKGKYFQKFVKNRKFELRVHAFRWVKDWVVQKRMGSSDEIAWNFSNGGYFQTVRTPKNNVACREALEMSKKILDMRRMDFGAIDFIVDSDNKVYFIEINSAPGFQELSKHIYVNAFSDLKKMTVTQIKKLLRK
jgi:glutathione synthase/RimK-type ligase-like ATP-grasp enzyme